MAGIVKSYRLAEYEITERNGEIRWKAHYGFGAARSGRCFIEGNILFLAPPCEVDGSSFLKNEFLEHLRKFPEWDRTKYYCARFEIHECSTAAIPGKHRPSRITPTAGRKPARAYVKTGDADDKLSHFCEQLQDIGPYLQNKAAGLTEIGRAMSRGFESARSSLKKIKFWK